MAAFNFREFVVKTVKENTVGLAGSMVKSVGYQVESTVTNLKDQALGTVQSIPTRIKDRIENLPQDIGDIPVAPGLSIEQLLTTLSDPATHKTDLAKAVESFTGINLNLITNFEASPRLAQARIDEFTGALRAQIMLEIQACIQSYLRGIVNKNLDIFELLHIEDFIGNRIAIFRLNLKLKIQTQVERLLYDKLKIQQVALLKQRILQAVRSMCPHAAGGVGPIGFSPSLERRIQTDRTWEIAQPDVSIQSAGTDHSLELATKSKEEGNTGQQIIDVTEDALADLGPMAIEQATGYDNDVVGNYISADGQLIV